MTNSAMPAILAKFAKSSESKFENIYPAFSNKFPALYIPQTRGDGLRRLGLRWTGRGFDLPTHAREPMLNAMRAAPIFASLVLSGAMVLGQAPTPAPTFEVASVRPSQHPVGPDYNNQITYLRDGITARNATLKRLIAEAYHLQLDQIFAPEWVGRNEYDINARAAGAATREQMTPMLRNLLAERFGLTLHSEMRKMRVYDLVVSKSGTKIRPIADEENAKAGAGFHFYGDMRQFADLLAVQFSIPAAVSPDKPVRASEAQIPVIDKTGLDGVFDFDVDIHPELGTDTFTLWRRALRDQLGLEIESRKGDVHVAVVDKAERMPTAN
jgi:uncharacterized protein (TIGR03435 family)